jgi:hypothetical protein
MKNLSNKTAQRTKTEQLINFYRIESTVLGIFNVLEYCLNKTSGIKSKRGILGVSNKVTSNKQELKINSNKGEDVLKYSIDYCNVNDFRALLKTKNFEVFYDSGKQVRLSEYALGVKGALSEMLFTPKGKLTSERLDSATSVSEPLTPIKYNDNAIVEQKILEIIQETTPHIPSRVPWAYGESLLDGAKPVWHSRFEKFVRSSIR